MFQEFIFLQAYKKQRNNDIVGVRNTSSRVHVAL